MSLDVPLEELVGRIEATAPGWTPASQLLVLAMLSTTTASLGGDIIEIGSWCGRSTAALASGLGAAPGLVHAIDIFPRRGDWRQNTDGSWSCFTERHGRTIAACIDPSVWEKPFREQIIPLYDRAGEDGVFVTFNRTLETFKVTDRVIAHPGEGQDFWRSAPDNLSCRLAFLDGDHSYEAVCADLDLVERYLKPGGWVCFDDAFTVYEGIDRAIRDRVIDRRYWNCRQATRKMFIAQRRA